MRLSEFEGKEIRIQEPFEGFVLAKKVYWVKGRVVSVWFEESNGRKVKLRRGKIYLSNGLKKTLDVVREEIKKLEKKIWMLEEEKRRQKIEEIRKVREKKERLKKKWEKELQERRERQKRKKELQEKSGNLEEEFCSRLQENEIGNLEGEEKVVYKSNIPDLSAFVVSEDDKGLESDYFTLEEEERVVDKFDIPDILDFINDELEDYLTLEEEIEILELERRGELDDWDEL